MVLEQLRNQITLTKNHWNLLAFIAYFITKTMQISTAKLQFSVETIPVPLICTSSTYSLHFLLSYILLKLFQYPSTQKLQSVPKLFQNSYINENLQLLLHLYPHTFYYIHMVGINFLRVILFELVIMLFMSINKSIVK